MDLILGIAVLVGCYFVITGIQKGVSRGVGAIEGAVTGNTRARGMEAVHKQLDFVAPVPGQQIVSRVLELLQLPSRATIRPAMYLSGLEADGSKAVIEVGSTLATGLQFVIATSSTDTGCEGLATATKWRTSDYLVTTTDDIERLHKYVRSVVAAAGGTVTESRS